MVSPAGDGSRAVHDRVFRGVDRASRLLGDGIAGADRAQSLSRCHPFSMFFHLEHHLFPQVPTARLHILARRLDAAAPESRLLVW